MQGGRARGLGSSAKLAAERGVGRGAFEDAFVPALEVEDGAADGDDRAAAGVNVFDCAVSRIDEPGGAEWLPRIDDVDEVVGKRLPNGGRWLGGADLHAAVDLHRVDAEDLGAEVFGDGARECAFAGGGAAGDDDDASFHVVDLRRRRLIVQVGGGGGL